MLQCIRKRKKKKEKKRNIATKDMSSGNNINYIKNKVTQIKNPIYQHFFFTFNSEKVK